MKFTNKKTLSFFLYITIALALLFSLFYPLFNTSAKAKSNIKFIKKYQTLTVNKQIRYQIKNLKKTNYVRFFISDSSLAHIHKKTGLLTAKKIGKVTVTANVYNKKQKKIKTLQDTISIIKKKNILPNAIFQVKETINPWNFTIKLSCNRILLKNEISADKLTLVPEGKSSPSLIASFTKLSDNGKEITYTLSASSQKKLCPGDFSMDGNYIVTSGCFSKKLTLTYGERLTQNTLSGFVLKENGNPIKNALLSLKRDGLPDKTCFSDNNGYYIFQNISKASSLFVKKEGYQDKTISNPAISSKGTTCENIILRSSKDTSATIKFLITDTENNPVSNAVISILSNEHAVPSTDNNTDPVLYSGSTDSSGTLLLTNSESLPAAPCSNLTLHQNSILSYSSSTQLVSTNKELLPASILNTTDYYTIYIHKFSPDNLSSSYQTQRLNFSFRDLITNQAQIHIQLEKCQNLMMHNLTLNSTNSLSDCHTVSLSFYHPQQKNAFYQYKISKDYFSPTNSNTLNQKTSLSITDYKISITSSLPLSIPDGIYYLSIHALSKENSILAASGILPVVIQNASLQTDSISLCQTRFARVLAYTDAENNLFSDSSFLLYQKCDTYYFLTGSFYARDFNKNNTYTTASILLSDLLPNQSYLLLSDQKSLSVKDNTCFLTTENNTYLTKNDARYSFSPITKIQCIPNIEKENASLPENFSNEIFFTHYQICHTISQDLIRSSKSYPNCVMAFYQTDGILLSLNLTIPPINQNTANSSYHTNSIIDIYTNKEILITNQDSYF